VTFLDVEVETTVALDDYRMVDYSADGQVVGVEFVSPSAGVDLSDVPHAAIIGRVIGESGFPFKVAV
jgi:uncharacterized protein YuzE